MPSYFGHIKLKYILLFTIDIINDCTKYIVCIGATLVFDVELLNVGDQAPTTNVFKEIDQDQDKQLSRDEVSEYLKKQMAAAEGAEGGDDIKQMMSDHEKLVEEIFQHEDKDKNGFISHDEFTGPKHDEL